MLTGYSGVYSVAQHNQAGKQAEIVAADYLAEKGFVLLARNWRTRYAEIDIVCTHSHVVYFIEVKYRSNARQGLGEDYITPKKIIRMQRAANLWVSTMNYYGEYTLGFIGISGDKYEVDLFISDLLAFTV